MGERSAHESRRRQFRQQRPKHHCSRCTTVLYEADEVCLECGAARPARGWPDLGGSTDPWLGRELGGRYLLTRRIGAGASGDVYCAESLTISRQFAVKIITIDGKVSTVKAEHVEARLSREIGALGHLRNPHIVSFYDVVPIGDRAVALLMDLIDGQTLETVVTAQGGLSAARACNILRQIANGVHEAHEAGMIHRDLKPENIMIERLPAGDDFVHILDFGIVWREGDVRVTQGFLGTPLYASPEQAVGGELDRRADIYGLGGVLFFMLTGRPPFVDDNVYKVLRAHVSTQPPRLSEVAPDRVFPAKLEELVRRMLAKNPGDRPQTLAGVIHTLDELSRELVDTERHPRDSQDLAAPNSPRTTGEASDAHRTVQSEASLTEASRPEASKPGAKKNDFFRSDDWDSTGPKAAILRGRTPTGPVEAIPREDTGGQTLHGHGFADPEAMRRDSGMYALPHLAGQTTDGLRFACVDDQQLAVADIHHLVRVGPPGVEQQVEVQLPASPELSALCVRGSTLLTGHVDGTLVHWEIGEGRSRTVHQNASASPITSIACDDRWLVFGTQSGALYLAHLDGESIQPLRIQSGCGVCAVALNPHRSTFAVARVDGSVGVFDVSSPSSLVHRFSAADLADQMAFSHDGYLLAVVFTGKKLALYHVVTGAQLMRNDRMIEQPLSVTFDANDQLVGYCEVDGRVYGWDLHHNLVTEKQP